MDSLTIRQARSDERATLEALQWRASLSNPGDREVLLAHPDAIEVPPEHIAAEHVVVAERGSQVVGFAALLPRADGDSELDALFVDPAAWRQGIGQSLVEHCVETARARGSRAIYVIGNPHATSFYEACGFEHLGTEPTRFGEGQRLRKSILFGSSQEHIPVERA